MLLERLDVSTENVSLFQKSEISILELLMLELLEVAKVNAAAKTTTKTKVALHKR